MQWRARRRAFSAVAACWIVLGVACNSGTLPVASITGAQGVLVDSASTPTPFYPLAPSATPDTTATAAPPPATATPSNPWGSFAGPVEVSAIEIPPPMPAFELPPGADVILLLGSDARPNESIGRNDTIMIAVVDRTAGRVTLISVPRDLYVYIPGWRVDRVNTAEIRGGLPMLYDTIAYNFGIRPSHMARGNFTGFIQGVDLLGGIDVQVGGYLYDECGGYYHNYSPGTVHMDGFKALCYVRMRKASSDFDRLRRQQEVLIALFQRVVSLNGLARLPELHAQLSTLVQTDLGLNDLLDLLPVATAVSGDPARIRRFSIDTSMATGWRVPLSGASVLLPNRDAIQAMLEAALPS
ncbi:MAG: LCP family protein [Anaerolineales bacterium]|nr:LCP family protein [Anaerolineales bacterium]